MAPGSDSAENVVTHHLSGARATDAVVHADAERLHDAEVVGQFLEGVPGPALVLNRFRQILAANRRLLDELGAASVEAVLGQRPGEAMQCSAVPGAPSGCGTGHRCAYCGCANTVARCLRDEKPASGECRLRLADGSSRDLEVAAAPAVVDGLPVVFVGLRDVSAERRRAVLERAFFHDVLNTAGGIQGMVELAARSGDSRLQEEIRTSLVVVAEDLVAEIQSHRQLCDAETGRLELRIEATPLSALLERARELYARHEVARERTLHLETPPTVTVRTDLALLRRVVGNMLKNAMEATPPGGAVRLWAQVEGENLEVHVRNPGVIPESTRHQIFQRSFSTKGPGRGIGTYSMKLLGERLLGGNVTFTSGEEEGTIFTLRLPGVCTPGITAEASYDAGGGRVVIADDFHLNRLILRQLLEARGCSVVEAADGDEALRAVRAGDVDLVITDLVMPEHDGIELTRAIRASERSRDAGARLPVILLTASADAPERDACLEAGATEVMEKPIRPQALTELLRRYLTQRA